MSELIIDNVEGGLKSICYPVCDSDLISGEGIDYCNPEAMREALKVLDGVNLEL